jgi:hypothetical protein
MRIAAWMLAAACLAAFVVSCAPSADEPAGTGSEEPAKPVAKAPDFEAEVRPMLVQNCLPCHQGPEPKGKLDVTKLEKTDTATIMEMVSEVEEGKMPPKTARPLDAVTKAKLLEALKASTLYAWGRGRGLALSAYARRRRRASRAARPAPSATIVPGSGTSEKNRPPPLYTSVEAPVFTL